MADQEVQLLELTMANGLDLVAQLRQLDAKVDEVPLPSTESFGQHQLANFHVWKSDGRLPDARAGVYRTPGPRSR